jgi:hypothetical protein
MKDRYFTPLRRNYGQTTVCVSIQQDGIRLHQLHHLIGSSDHVTDGLCQGLASGIQKMIRFPDAEIPEKDVIQFIIVILARMHQDMFRMNIQLADNPAELYDFGASAHDSHDLC